MAAWVAKRCVPVASSWVEKFIQGCGGEFAVQYKRHTKRVRGVVTGGVPGVVCYYPTAPKTYFDLAITWPSAGKFCRRFLAKKLPYTIIKDPCPPGTCQACCPGLPATLHATVNGGTNCPCFNGTYPLTFTRAGDPSNQTGLDDWQCDVTGFSCPNCVELKLAMYCPAGSTGCAGLRLDAHGINGSGVAVSNVLGQAPGSCTCSPLSVAFALNFSGTGQCCGVALATLNVTVTL